MSRERGFTDEIINIRKKRDKNSGGFGHDTRHTDPYKSNRSPIPSVTSKPKLKSPSCSGGERLSKLVRLGRREPGSSPPKRQSSSSEVASAIELSDTSFSSADMNPVGIPPDERVVMSLCDDVVSL